jgi:adhesin transport system membrane fusion protein
MWQHYDDPDLKLPESRHSRVLYALVAALVVAMLWAMLFKVDQVVRGTGTVIASSRVQLVQAVDGGVIDSILVREGDRVKSGQVVARLDQTRLLAQVRELDARLAALRAESARLRAEVSRANSIDYPADVQAFPELIAVQNALFRQNIETHTEAISALTVAVNLAREDADLVQALAVAGDVSRSEVIKARRALNEAQAKLNNLDNDYLQKARDALAQTEDEIAQNAQVRALRFRQLEDSVLRSSVNGIVKNLNMTNSGAVLRAGEELMQIVPVDEALIVEAKINPADIAKLDEGLPSGIRFDAFDYTVFGAVDGQVSYVSADTLKEETNNGERTFYRVHVETSGVPVTTRAGHAVDILPGMTAQVDIKTGERTLMAWLLKPIRKTLTQAFGER